MEVLMFAILQIISPAPLNSPCGAAVTTVASTSAGCVMVTTIVAPGKMKTNTTATVCL